MEKIDYKQWNKELYAPKNFPTILTVPAMNFIMVNGQGNPNDEDGEYSKAVELLYALSYSIKMTRKSKLQTTENFTDYVVPPLEGLWWMRDENNKDFTNKDKYCWVSMIRQPEFITHEEFLQAKKTIMKKKPELDSSKARYEVFEEGLCVQCMHIGPYATEPATVKQIDEFILNNGYLNDFGKIISDGTFRTHHEIYLSDPRKSNPATMKTILRHPIRKAD